MAAEIFNNLEHSNMDGTQWFLIIQLGEVTSRGMIWLAQIQKRNMQYQKECVFI